MTTQSTEYWSAEQRERWKPSKPLDRPFESAVSRRIEAYLLRRDVHFSICRVREEIARARFLTLAASPNLKQNS